VNPFPAQQITTAHSDRVALDVRPHALVPHDEPERGLRVAVGRSLLTRAHDRRPSPGLAGTASNDLWLDGSAAQGCHAGGTDPGESQ
jgi:hypothetical protein